MSIRPFALSGRISPLVYMLTAPPLVLSQHLAVALCHRSVGAKLETDYGFWLLPLRRLASMPGLTSTTAAAVFTLGFLVAWGLAVLSFRRASWSNRGHRLSLFAIFPAIQIGVVLVMGVLPRRDTQGDARAADAVDLADVLQGVIAGVAIVVAAVLISALSLGAYGWGLFVTTPLVVGMTTGYIANRRVLRSKASTVNYVILAGALGGMALLMLALEGLLCIVLIAPLALGASLFGGWIGRATARIRHHRGTPLMSVAALPLVFALEAAMPPAAPIDTSEAIEIAASPEDVWRVITSEKAIDLPPGLPGLAGLAYPLRGRLIGEGVGARRLGYFSTGVAHERVTAWQPHRLLAFTVVSQPPAMEEMSPYRDVQAPHLDRNTLKTESWAGYVQAEVHVTPELDLIGGYRLTNDKKTGINYLVRLDGTQRTEPFRYDNTRSNFSLGANYKFTSDVLVYAKYSTGFVAGGVTSTLPFDPETVKSWEAGVKADLFDRRVRFNLAAFKADYKNLQATAVGFSLPVPQPELGTIIVTQGDLDTKGFEAEVTLAPVDGLTIAGSLGYTDWSLSNFDPQGVLGNPANFELNYRTHWTGTASVQYETQPLFAEATLLARLDGNWRDRMNMYTQINVPASFEPLKTSPAGWVLNGRVALRNLDFGAGSAEIAVWGRNLTNSDRPVFPLNYFYAAYGTFEQRRTYGADLTLNF